MNKKVCVLSLLILLVGCPSFAHGRHHHYSHHYHYYSDYYRPYYRVRVYRPVYYQPYYYEPRTVIVDDNYVRINTAANVINAAANVAATIRFLSW